MSTITILTKIQTCFKEDSRKRYYYAAYSVLFGVLALCCFSWFIVAGKSLVWQDDGWMQHFRAITYYAKYLREIARNLLFEHKLVIPDWDFHIGEGGDVVNTFHYYVMGDPIALLSVFVPTRFMQYFFSASCVLRLYLAGIAFSELCFGTGVKNRYGVMAGAFTFAFSAWGLFNVARHPYFLNPMIYFPLMILGIEQVIHKKKPYLFIFSAAVSAASNFYFFYMIVILAVAYALIRLAFLYRSNIRQGLCTLLQLGGYAVIGVCMAGIILLPVLMFFLQDSRLSSSQAIQWLYPLSYYSLLPSRLMSNNTSYWLCLGITAPAVLAVFLLLQSRKKNTLLKTLLLLCLLFMLFPLAGRFFNGMSYVTNRWCWAFNMLCGYILALEWEHLLALTRKEWRKLFAFGVIYYLVCLAFVQSRVLATYSALILLFIALALLWGGKSAKTLPATTRTALLLGISMFGVFNTALWEYSPNTFNYVAQFKDNSTIWDEWRSTEARLIKEMDDSEFVRYSGRSLTQNANVSMGISSTQYYWTLSNPFVNNYRYDLEMREPMVQWYDGYDDRTTPLVLAAAEYYTIPQSSSTKGIPYGLELIETKDADTSSGYRVQELCRELGVDKLTPAQENKIAWELNNIYSIYRNNYALPLGYCYDSYIPAQQWNALDPVQKQQTMLSAAVVDDEPENLSKYTAPAQDYTVAYDAICNGSEISKTDEGFVTTSGHMTVTLELDGEINNAETYVCIEGLRFKATPELELYYGGEDVDPLNLYNKTNWKILSPSERFNIRKEKRYWDPVVDTTLTITSNAGTSKTISYQQPESSFSSGRHDFIANLGYLEEPVTSITITFAGRGIYTFDNLQVYRVGMEEFPDQIEKLRESSLENVRLETDSLYGDIETDSTKILCIAVPYSSGWRGFIDGAQTEVFCMNDHYLGMIVPAGAHEISMHYSMPYKKLALLITVIGFVALGAVRLFRLKNRPLEKSTSGVVLTPGEETSGVVLPSGEETSGVVLPHAALHKNEKNMDKHAICVSRTLNLKTK